jgi:putative ABC transport system permease protein
LFRHSWQLALAVLGIALGVAVVVAIDVANGSAQRAFELSSDAIVGKATHQIVGFSGEVPQDLYRNLRVDQGVRDLAPVVQGDFTISGFDGRVFSILGIDPFAESGFRSYLGDTLRSDFDLSRFLVVRGAVLLEKTTADELGLQIGDSFSAEVGDRTTGFELIGYLQTDDDGTRDAISEIAIVDISTAQEVLGLGGVLTRIDLIVDEGEAGVSVLEEIRSALPENVEIQEASASRGTADQMTRAFRLNLQALSLLALLCGTFLIYNTMTFAVVQRRQLLAVLRAIGTTRRQILLVIVVEAVLLGLVGTLIGQVAGVALGKSLVGLVTQTINDLYYVVSVRSVAIDPWTLAKGWAVGIGATLVAALAPAIEATSTPPRRALETVELEARVHRAVPAATLFGLVLLGVGSALLLTSGQKLVPAFIGLFAFLMGTTCLTPIFTLGLMAALTPIAGRLFGQLGRLATRGVSAMLSRTGIAVAALMMALAVTVGVDLMIRSFRATVEDWLEYSLPADLYVSTFVSPARRFSSGPTFDSDVLESLERVPGVVAVNALRHFQANLDGTPARAVAMAVAPESRSAFSFVAVAPEQAWSVLDSGDGIIVSEALAYRRSLTRGDAVVLETPSGPRLLSVAGIFYDYSSEQGVLMLSRELYRDLWADDSLTAISLHLAEDVDARLAKAEILDRLGDQTTAKVVSNRELRNQSMRVFDRTFRITAVLRALAVIVAFIGVLSSLMALQLERTREQGVLLAQGMTPAQLWHLISQQTGLMGLTAGLLSVPVGIAIAVIMVTVINRRSFGWTLELLIVPTTLVQAVAVGVVAALLAGLYPAWRMSRTSPAEALRGE